MKNYPNSKVIVLTVILATSAFATSTYAASRVKPPTADAQVVVWYQPVLDFFNF